MTYSIFEIWLRIFVYLTVYYLWKHFGLKTMDNPHNSLVFKWFYRNNYILLSTNLISIITLYVSKNVVIYRLS